MSRIATAAIGNDTPFARVKKIADSVPKLIAVAFLAATVAACATVPEKDQPLSSQGHVRSWADWSAANGG